MEITKYGFQALGIAVPEMVHKRIAMLSDGFAYFTHLLGLKLATCAIDRQLADVGVGELEAATAEAVESSEVYLRNPYEKAVRKYQNHELILWALADHFIMERQYKDIYQSYLDVCESVFKAEGRVFSPPDDGTNFEESDEADSEDETPEADRTSALTVFTKAQFSNALQRLRNDSHGSVIESPKVTHQRRRDDFPRLGREARLRRGGYQWRADERSRTRRRRGAASWRRSAGD